MIKNIKQFLKRRLETKHLKELKRNLKKKFNKLKTKFEPELNLYNTNLLVNSKKKASYNMIINAIRSKNSNIIIRNASKAKKIEKQVLVPKLIWPASRGTYVRKTP